MPCSATPTRPPGRCTAARTPPEFAAGYGDEAKLGRDRISLRALSPQLRLEWQYAFQVRSDAGRQKVDPGEAQRAVNFTAGAGVTSLLDWDEDRWRQHKPPPGQPGVSATTPRSLIIYARRQAEELAFGRGWDVEYPRDTWRLRNLGINDPIAHVRFGGIPQPWLKDLAKRWCRWRLATGLSPGSPARGARVLAHFGTWLAGQDEDAPASRRSPGRCWNATSPPCMPSSAAGSCKESTSRTSTASSPRSASTNGIPACPPAR